MLFDSSLFNIRGGELISPKFFGQGLLATLCAANFAQAYSIATLVFLEKPK